MCLSVGNRRATDHFICPASSFTALFLLSCGSGYVLYSNAQDDNSKSLPELSARIWSENTTGISLCIHNFNHHYQLLNAATSLRTSNFQLSNFCDQIYQSAGSSFMFQRLSTSCLLSLSILLNFFKEDIYERYCFNS